ncbi:Tumor suppressing sub-chromosomal transferable candidate [Quillaja saponaria]|uniref:U5 small nuclear ribonucleoprotein TSSC4 n=1 Tax=Quillaja saponaria TaxID=32244 RepID=A0AAD7VDL5_QUISA|nr:Tumor suppressing sub-chromosomal transferable candidate [Quillaja saponaria]KAJ7971784.1 Tumor suppressing sub-chromosomal transferable candidate [Quillaja saponaria]
MEDSFSVRVDKIFGSLASSSTPSSSVSSLWSLTDEEIEKRKWNRSMDTPESESNSHPLFEAKGFEECSSSLQDEVEEDLEDLEDDVDDAEGSRMLSKPDDYDDEAWEIKSSIGRDCTLDFEEEEDVFDKQAVGKEKSGDRLYMKDIKDDGVEITCNVLPTSFRDVVRDPRANHLAAKVRLKEDAEAAKKIDALYVSEKAVTHSDGAEVNAPGDDVKPKSILKKKDDQSDLKSKKRVRFDSEYEESEGAKHVRAKSSSSMEVVAASNEASSQSHALASAVPDYLRNPSRYTHYTFDSETDMDEESNKQAYMDFLKLLHRSNTTDESQTDDLPSVIFISKKKSSDAAMSKQNHDNISKGFTHKRGLPAGIVAEDNDICEMEEDEPEPVYDKRNTSQGVGRQYRRKTGEELEEPIV